MDCMMNLAPEPARWFLWAFLRDARNGQESTTENSFKQVTSDRILIKTILQPCRQHCQCSGPFCFLLTKLLTDCHNLCMPPVLVHNIYMAKVFFLMSNWNLAALQDLTGVDLRTCSSQYTLVETFNLFRNNNTVHCLSACDTPSDHAV